MTPPSGAFKLQRAHKEFDRPLNPLRHLKGGIGIRAEKYITLLPPPPPLPAPTLKTATENGEEGEEEEARADEAEGHLQCSNTSVYQTYIALNGGAPLSPLRPSAVRQGHNLTWIPDA